MKRRVLAILLLCLLTALPAAAQHPRARDFAVATDSLQQRLKRRTGVDCRFKLEKVLVRGSVLDFYFSQNFAGFPWRQEDIPWLREQLFRLGKDKMQGMPIGSIYAKHQLLSELPMPAPGRNGKPAQTSLRVDDPRGKTVPLVRGDKLWPLGLSGRHIALWQSHGRYWEPATQRWEWQRGPCHRTVEDLYTQSYVLPFLMPMLENAGAVVMSPRERDPQPLEVICDNDPGYAAHSAAAVRLRGKYSESGSWTGAGTGFADAKDIYGGDDNPFRMGTARMTQTATTQSAQAIWRPDIPETGDYAVYVSYPSFSNSTTDARYTVHHLGGETLLHVNQQMGGGTWIYLGTFRFAQGDAGYVSLSNRSASGGVVGADAVRFGGGMGKVERGGCVSGLPAYLEAALYNFQWSGIPMSLLEEWEGDYKKDVSAHGIWVQELSGGSRVNPSVPGRRIPFDLSLAFHTDAGVTPDDAVVGTLAIYTRLCENSDLLPDGESRMNGRLLADFVQTEVVDAIRADFEPDWVRREVRDRSYSETRITGVPAMILELLAHQNFADMRYGLDPSFRFTVSRAVYKGVLKYLSARYGCPYAVQPLPVHAFRARREGKNVLLSWEPTADALEPTAKPTSYRVYTRIDGGGFDAGQKVQGTSVTLPQEAGHVYSYKVTACNDGGESSPSEILASAYPSALAKEVLIVNNFTRVSAPSWFDTPQFAGFTEDLDSGVPWGMDILYAGPVNQFNRAREWTDDDNPGFGGSFADADGLRQGGNTFDFVSQHGRALLGAGYAFSSCSAEAFDGTETGYFALDLVCGKQLTTEVGRGAVPNRYPVFPEALQEALRRFTGAGGHVLLSGAYIGTDAWDAVYQHVPLAPETTRSFIQEVLGYRWVTNFGDHSGRLQPASGSPLPSASYNRSWSPYLYRVENPDGLAPAGESSRLLLRYRGSEIGAAVFYEAPAGYRVAAFGYPLEVSPEMAATLSATLRLLEGR